LSNGVETDFDRFVNFISKTNLSFCVSGDACKDVIFTTNDGTTSVSMQFNDGSLAGAITDVTD
jgi:hypothetical protein